MIGIIVAWLASAAAAAGPFALAGGPLGVIVAGVAGFVARPAVKIVAVLLGLALLTATAVGVTVRIQHLEQDRIALGRARADLEGLRDHVAAVGAQIGCDRRAPAERELGACIAAQRADAAQAKALEIQRQRQEAAAEQERLDRERAKAEAAAAAEAAAIDADAAAGDGPVPGVLLKAWARERAARGLK